MLKRPLESGRQSPDSIGFALLVSVFIQSLFYYLTYHVAAYGTIYPNAEKIQSIHFWITAILVVFSFVYAIPAIYYRSQKIQYLLLMLVTLNGVASFSYLTGTFLIAEGIKSTRESLLKFTQITMSIAVILLVLTTIRLYLLLAKGFYRKGSSKDKLREKFETKSHIPIVIIGSTGMLFVLQYTVRTSGLEDLYRMLVILIFFVIFYVLLFMVPEQLVILYCKFRFKSFNFDKKGFMLRD